MKIFVGLVGSGCNIIATKRGDITLVQQIRNYLSPMQGSKEANATCWDLSAALLSWRAANAAANNNVICSLR